MYSEKACCVGRQPGLHLPCFFGSERPQGMKEKLDP